MIWADDRCPNDHVQSAEHSLTRSRHNVVRSDSALVALIKETASTGLVA